MRAPSSLELATLRAAHERATSSDKQHLARMGVVHTPLELVDFALRLVERALQRDFGLAAGLSSRNLQILDPALGTGIWLSSLMARLQAQAQPRALLGFDADPAAVESARMLLEPAARARQLPLHLVADNTLERAQPWLSGDEIRVVLGNPPWRARSASRGSPLSDRWLREFHRDHRGDPLRERRTGVLSDDYVRFFRWALEQARSAARGALLCFVTNASYLDGPVHRGMRAALAGCFQRIELFDLGGGSLRSRGSSPDEALFPVRVPAALCLCVRTLSEERSCVLSHVRLRGSRQEKLRSLANGEFSPTLFAPTAPHFLFVPPPTFVSGRPLAGFALDEVFPVHGEGVQTNRDALATDPDAEQLLRRLAAIARGAVELKAAAHFAPERVRRALAQALERDPRALVRTLAYRPLEQRAYCTLAGLCHRPRQALADAIARSSLCLLSTRKEPGDAPWNMFAAVRTVADSSFLSVRSACRTRLFPSHTADGLPNLDANIAQEIALRIGRVPSVQELMLYALGALGSPGYRAAHGAAWKLSYARVPWPPTLTMFTQTAQVGARFFAALTPGEVSETTLVLESDEALDRLVDPRTFRWRAPHRLELCSGTQIRAGDERPFRAQVGHHDLLARLCASPAPRSIRAVYEACARAAMWCEAERAAEAAYQAATSVGGAAKRVAPAD